jgi:acyl-CoA dehydrogenase
MGMTREYPLHHLTRRLWSWRSEFGDERRGSRALGDVVVAAGADQLYPLITGGTSALDVA